jgi:hypothetical protein
MSDDSDERPTVGDESTTESDAGPTGAASGPAESDAGSTPTDDRAHGERDAPLGDLAERRRARREERESTEADTDDPFSALGREVDAGDRGQAADSEPTASEDAFEQMDVEPVDSEDVWADLLDDETAAGDGPVAQTAATETGGTVVGAAAETATESTAAGDDADDAGPAVDPLEEHVIPKADYCQKCAYFSDPPDVTCGHEGTDIVSVEDFEHFRVRGCPVVENEFDPDDR